jgi:hypothetical protein
VQGFAAAAVVSNVYVLYTTTKRVDFEVSFVNYQTKVLC